MNLRPNSGARPANYVCYIGQIMYRAAASIALMSGLAIAAGESKFALTIDNIMRGPNLTGYPPAQVRWSGDSSKIYFQWKRAADSVAAPMDTYVINRDGSELHKLSDDEARLAPSVISDTNEDRSLSVFSQDGDIVLVENATGKRRQITKTAEAETNPRFVPGERRITFMRGGNLYAMSLDNGDLEQLTDIRTAGAPVTDGAAERRGRTRGTWRRCAGGSIGRHAERDRRAGIFKEGTARDV